MVWEDLSWGQIFSFLPFFRVGALLDGSGIGFRVLVLYFLATLNDLAGTSLLSSSSSSPCLFYLSSPPPLNTYTCERGPIGVRVGPLDGKGALIKDERIDGPGRRGAYFF